MSEDKQAPTHIGFIVDGNRRWAKSHGLPVYEGHLAGHSVFHDLIVRIKESGVKYASFYVFSTENWKRSEDEVSRLMALVLKILKDDLADLIKDEIRLRVLGSRERLSESVINAIEAAEKQTKHFKDFSVALCFNYGGQKEIVDAVKKCLADGLTSEQITEDAIAERLYAPDVPSIDLVVRTSGEQRLSNFMLWRSAYSEFLFLEKYWPDMTPADIDAIIEEYNRRARRFGG